MRGISGLLVRAKMYGLPEEKLREIVARDKTCIYCHKRMKRHASSIGTPSDKATIEHFSNVAEHGEAINVGICCGSCNSSRSDSMLFDWFKSQYCLKNKINQKTVAKPIKDYIKKYGRRS